MRRLTRFIGVALCVGMLCSSVICSAMVASAEETTVASSESSSESATTSGNISSSVTEISIGAKDSNDYLEVLDGSSMYAVKKDGYYSVSYNFDGKWYGDYYDGDIPTETDGFDDVKDSIVFTKFSAGEVISYSNIYSDSDFYIGYSEDGKELSTLIKVTPETVPIIGDACSIEIDSALVKESSTSVVFSFNVYCTSEDVTLSDMTLQRDDENGQIFFDVDSVLGETSHKFEYEFTENGKYILYVTASDGSYKWINISVGSIDNSLQVEDEFVDSTAPILTVETSKATGLSAGDSYAITVKSDELCNIKIANRFFADVTEATAYVQLNGVYEIFAVDSWGNSTTETVKVTAFGDGSMPADFVENTFGNENPVNLSNKDNFWEDAMNNALDGDISSNASSGTNGVLPQTGSPLWVAVVFGSAAVLTTGGIFAVRKVRKSKKNGGIVDDK